MMIISHSFLRETVALGTEQSMNYCLLEVTTPSQHTQVRANIDLVMVIDKSGSMDAENKLNNVQVAAEHLIKLLGPSDRISLVVFACEAAEVFPLTEASNKSFFIDRIRNVSSISVGGTTVMSSGMEIGYKTLGNSNSTNLKRMIILTDGEITEPSDKRCRELASQCSSNGIQIRCIGVGSEWNWELLNNLDWKHEAEYIRNDEINLISEKIAREYEGFVNTYAIDAILQFNLVNGVTIQKCNRFHPKISPVDCESGTNNLMLGSLLADSKEYFVLQLLLPPRTAEGTYNLGQYTITYKSPIGSDVNNTPPNKMRITYSADGILASMVNADVQRYVKQLTAYSMVERATGLINAGDISIGTSILGKAAQLTGTLGDSNLQNMLTGVLESVKKTGILSTEEQKDILSQSRKTSILNNE